MELNMTSYKVKGPNHTQIIDPIVYNKLSQYLKINSHGMQEVEVDVKNMTVQGSDSFLKSVETIQTHYDF